MNFEQLHLSFPYVLSGGLAFCTNVRLQQDLCIPWGPSHSTLRIPLKLQPNPRVFGFFRFSFDTYRFVLIFFFCMSDGFLNQRNLRPVVSVGVSTECVRLEFEGPHAQDKYGCNQKLANYGIGSVKHIGRKKCNIDCIISFGYISQIGKNIQISIVLFPLDIFHKLSRNYD